ncbi:hypothetical protein RFM99_15815 [Mesorhizobium sp. VK4C]|uniref:hypothetical protein n=1 Tax=Mesorhizobium captivum TaxID=3072319 RepID=UPI002A2458EB|nr:hypothetical protein [Mesorhizobium sp. VK4C]MDX8499886.1 hypothetical protein [Mesorhizobium sp. VK4C]
MAAALASETINVRRISWQELWKLRPDLRPANDNDLAVQCPTHSAATAARYETASIK